MCKNAVPKGREGDWTAVRDAFFADYFDRLCDSTVPYPEMPELLETLQAHGYRLAVVTNKPDPHAKKLLKTAAPLCAVGLMVCLVWIIVLKKKQ